MLSVKQGGYGRDGKVTGSVEKQNIYAYIFLKMYNSDQK